MRGEFLAFLGDVERAAWVAVAADRRGLAAVDLSLGRLVFASEGLPARRDEAGQVIVGDYFAAAPAAGPTSNGAWGSYVRFFAEGGSLRVDRAPLTGMPLYWCRCPGGVACASDPMLIRELSGPPTIDWEFVATSLAYVNLRTERTGLEGIRELLGGTVLVFDGTSANVLSSWLPWPYVANRFESNLESAASELERRIIDSTAAWSGSRRSVIVELSGGLDSSIVTAALASANADASAITFATPDAEGDERIYARAVAERCGITLAEVVHDDSEIDLIAVPEAIGARPGAYGLLSGLDQSFAENVPDLSRPIFGGIGGDSVFQFDTTVAPILAVDGRFGISGRVARTVRDDARARGATFWEAARLSWRAHRAGPRMGWRRDTSYLSVAAIPARPLAHPWDLGASGASQAKRNHVESIRRILDFLDRPGRWRSRDVVAPLLSQPVVEFCLSVPSDMWFAGGRDRAVARAAFAGRLPADVIWRRGKGRMEALCAAAYMRQRAQLRDLLLGGRLADEGLLNRPAIEAYLARDLSDGEFDYFRLIEIGDVERWVRSVEAGTSFGSSSAHR